MAQKTKLVIVESPTKAKTIAKYLGKNYTVEASQGHLRDLPRSQMGIDVDNDFAPRYITIRGRGEILTKIRKEAKSASQILLATDPDREGEAISWHLTQLLGIDPASCCRIEFHEVTKKAVQEAVKNPRPVNLNLVDAQQARRVLDRLVGYSISPLLWAKVKKGLSAGRVQSVATHMIITREEEIENFLPEEYWDVTAQVKTTGKTHAQFRLAQLKGDKAVIRSAEEAKAAEEAIRNGHFTVTAVRVGEKRKTPQPPFTTSSLQQEASRKLNFTTQKTMQVIQSLYEGVELGKAGSQGLVTYIRTDSVRVSDEAIHAVRETIADHFGSEYLPEEANQFKGRKNAQDAHEAIRPTDMSKAPDAVKDYLTRDQYRLYKLVYDRFLASQMTPALYETLQTEAADADTLLRFNGEKKVFPGFTAVYEESTDDEEKTAAGAMPVLKEGDSLPVADVEVSQHFTQPPARYTEASLVRAMEEKGIGRPSTYAPTITTIIARNYVSRDRKRLFPTELGKQVDDMMTAFFKDIVDEDFTATMETDLDRVEEGEIQWQQVLRAFWPEFSDTLKEANEKMEKVELQDEVSDIPCESCGAMMVYKMSRFGKFLACPNFPACRNTKAVLNYIEAPCPKCGGRLIEKTSRKGRRFYGCEHYPECDFVSWDRVAVAKCPKCGTYMTEKYRKNGEKWYICANEECRCTVQASPEKEEE